MSGHPYPHTDREILRRVERSAGQRVGYKQLVRELGMGGGRERRLLMEQLARMTARGALVKVDREQWALPVAANERAKNDAGNATGRRGDAIGRGATRENLVAGKLDLHRDGFGFVRANDGEGDIFIPPNEINGAMQGDEVLVDEAPRGRDGRRSGRVARVLTRKNPTVVGIFHAAKPGRRYEDPLLRGNYVTPLDERMTQVILIPEGMEIPRERNTPHRVLGAEAVAQQAATLHRVDHEDHSHESSKDIEDEISALDAEAMDGLAVDVEVVDFPTTARPAKGRVLEVLGDSESFGVDVEIVIRKHHLPHVFPENVLEEAQESATHNVASLSEEDRARRTDFRGEPIVTIDGETAKDFDDAVMVKPLGDGTFELQVHIADVAEYVHEGTALDLEARLRGNSVYFPDRAIPMLPQELSTGECSLRPDEDRLVLSCVMRIDADGNVLGYEVGEGIIRSARRMTYTAVQKILDGDVAMCAEYAPLVPEFERMYDLALRLNGKRKRRGSIDFDLPEPVIQFDEQGAMRGIVRSERAWANRLIEEFMLAANECVARWIESQGVPGIYRIHELPDPKRIVEFEDTAAGFGYSLGFGALPVKKVVMKGDRRDARRHGDGRAAKSHEVVERIDVTPQMYQRLTARIAGKPEERILSYLMLRSLKQARYSEKNEGHFALAAPAYTHFTSPIRRYPDLIVHRIVKTLLREGADPVGEAEVVVAEKRSGSRVPQIANSDGGKAVAKVGHPPRRVDLEEPLPAAEIAAIAQECSETERRAADAERELIEWKKIKFMQDRVGEDFSAMILSATKYGLFVELDDLYVEGLVPLHTLTDDRYSFRENSREICGDRHGRCYRLGQRVRVLLDRVDRMQKRLQFAILQEEREETAPRGGGKGTRPYVPRKEKAAAKLSPDRSGKPKRGGPKAGKGKGKRRK